MEDSIKKVYPAIRCEQNNKQFYLACIPSDVLRKCSFVSRRAASDAHGFQRMLNETRAKDIARYLDEQKGVIPSALILSSQPQAKFEFNKANSSIEFYAKEDCFMVIDGQHRLFGFDLAAKSYLVPVVIFDSLKTTEEVKLFIDINTTQKGVPAALLLDIKKMAGTETKIEERQRILFDMLNTASALKDKFSSSKSARGKISRKLFYDATNSIFTSGPLSGENGEIIYKAVSNFIAAMQHTLEKSGNDEAQLHKGIYFKASFEIFHEVAEAVLNDYSNMKEESFIEILEPISTLPFDNYSGSNNATVKKLANDMRTAIHQRRRKPINGDMF